MVVDLQNRPSTPDADDLDPGRKHFDEVLNGLGSAEHMAKNGTSGELSGDKKAESPASLAASESAAGGAASAVAGIAKKTNPGGQLAAIGSFLWGSKRRKQATVTGGVTSLAIGAFSIASLFLTGPLQVIHLGEMLDHSFAKGTSDSSNRTGHLYRYAKTGNIAETRLGTLGSRVYGKSIAQLKDIGVEIETGRTGQPTRTRIDTEKLKEAYPELDGKNAAERKAFLSDKLGVSVDLIDGKGNVFTIDQTKMGIGDARLLAKSNLGLLNDGKIINGIKARTLTKALDLPSLFHPIERAKASLTKKYVNGKPVDEKQQAADEEAADKKALVETAAGDAAAPEIDTAKDKLTGVGATTTRALTFTGFACQARAVGDEVVAIDRKRVVLPAIAAATRVIAAGSQVKSGHDLSAVQVGALVDSFTGKNGKTIWQSKPLQALSGSNDATGLKDIDKGQRQAFSSNKSVNAINDVVSGATGGHPDIACSNASLFFQGAFTIAFAGIQEIGSGFLASPAVLAEFAGKQAVQFVASAAVMHLINSIITDNASVDALSKDAFNGISGGALYAYGARAAANQAAITTGGVALGNDDSTLVATQAEAQDKRAFESENMFARVFDIKDYRSLSGRLVQSVNPKPMNNVASLVSSLANVGSWLPNTISKLTPTAAADSDTSYDWGFTQYGVPQDMLDDPALADPYANANAVAKLFDGQCKNGDDTIKSDCSYAKRIQACFGNELTYTADDDGGKPVWDVKVIKNNSAADSVDPNSTEYLSSANDCGGVDKQDWRRITMFVFDSATMKAAACYDGDDDSCGDIGVAQDTSADTASGAAGSLRIASYNLLDATAHASDSKNVGNCSSAGDSTSCLTLRSQRQSDIIHGTGQATNPPFDIVGTQETSQPQYKILKGIMTDYSVYPENASGLSNGKDGKLAIWWNSSKFTLVNSGKSPGISNIGVRINNPWVELKDSAGNTFYFMSIHYANQYFGGTAADIKRSSQLTMDWVRSVVTPTTPVFVVGDFNDELPQKLSYCVYTQGGLMQNTMDMADGKSKDQQCPTGKSNGIDEIYATPVDNVSATDWKHIGNNGIYKIASDHTPVYVTIGLGATTAATAPGAWTWPVAKANFHGLSQCFEKPGHTGIDIPVPTGTPVYAAKDGTVVKIDADGGTDGGKYIIIQHGTGLYSNYQHNSQILVQPGQVVHAGDKIAVSGATGFVTGPHVHFSVTTQAGLDSRGKVAYSVDPIGYLPNDRNETPCK